MKKMVKIALGRVVAEKYTFIWCVNVNNMCLTVMWHKAVFSPGTTLIVMMLIHTSRKCVNDEYLSN